MTTSARKPLVRTIVVSALGVLVFFGCGSTSQHAQSARSTTTVSTDSEPPTSVVIDCAPGSHLENGTCVPDTTTTSVTVTTTTEPNCTSGYDPCIPPGSDVDCAGGSGNGPRYVRGPVRVTGPDIYDLDRDGDGIGCE